MGMKTACGVAYRRTGSGEPLLLIHGTGGSHSVWNPVLDFLAHERDVVAVDLPGCGASPRRTGDGPLTNASVAEHLAAFAEEIGLERPHVGGASLGGHVALLLGARGLARSVVAFSPTGFYTAGEARRLRALVSALRLSARLALPLAPRLARSAAGRQLLLGSSYGKPAAVPPEAAVDTVRSLALSTSVGDMLRRANRELPGGGLACTPEAAAHPNVEIVEGLADVPVTIAWAQKDVFLPVRMAARARRAFPHARHEVIAGAGHLATWDAPSRVADLLLESSLAATGAGAR
ncbi:alpha/beta fold hydrolase [Streptomyces sp. I05A-00742]|uniref:alpha/beta fold hydrolase n=1 Tax=Streptomyces sp. I05A-00742 TaxID=2732853 RepID=UPI00148782C8|nr:alpha/beta hydrolase [Streptomyces sp. I05A-00742]